MIKFLTQHLTDSDTTYFEHLKFALYAGIMLLYAGIASLIHGLFPFLFKGTAAYIVVKLYKERLENHSNPLYQEWVKNGANNKKNH